MMSNVRELRAAARSPDGVTGRYTDWQMTSFDAAAQGDGSNEKEHEISVMGRDKND